MESYKPEYSLFIADGLGFMLSVLYLLFTTKEHSIKNLIRVSYIIWIINLICIPIWAFTLPPLWAFILIFFHILLNCKCVIDIYIYIYIYIAVSLGVVESVILKLSGSISPSLTTAVTGGQGYSGLINCFARIIIEISVGQSDENTQASAIIAYFAVSIIFMIFAYFGFEYLQHVSRDRDEDPPREENSTETQSSFISSIANEPHCQRAQPPKNLPVSRVLERRNIWKIAKQVKWLLVAFIFVMLFHYLIFPGYIIKMNLRDYSCTTIALALITVFSICDTLGRTFANKLGCLTKAIKSTLVPPFLVRAAFILLIILIPIYQQDSALFSAWYFVIGVLIIATIVHSILFSIIMVLIMEKVIYIYIYIYIG